MHVIFLILKILGVTLLGILGLLVLVLLSVLFLPIVYRAEAEYKDGTSGLWIRIHWMFPFLCINGGLDEDNKFWYCLRIFGFVFRTNRKKQKPKRRKEFRGRKAGHKRKNEKKRETDDLTENRKSWEKEAPVSLEISQRSVQAEKEEQDPKETQKVFEEAPGNTPDSFQKEPEEKTAETEEKKVQEKAAEKKENTDNKKQAGLCSKIKGIFRKVKNFFLGIPARLRAVAGKFRKIGHKMEKITSFLGDSRCQRAFRRTKHFLRKVFGHILPAKIRGTVRFGLEDPAATGMLYGILTLFYGRYGNSLSVVPEFQQPVFEGHVKLKGRIVLGVLGIRFWKLWKNDEFKYLLAEARKLKEEL